MARTYGQEWRSNDVDAIGELMAHLRSRTRRIYPGTEIVLERVIREFDDRHWILECEDLTPHAHMYLKWRTDEPA